MRITSVNNQKIKDLVKLHTKKYRDKTNTFLIEGYHLVEEALKVGIVLEIYTVDEDYKGENVVFITDEVLKKISCTKTPQGIVALCKKIEKKDFSDKILMLDNVQDPGNLGTLIRSAVAFGFDTVVLDNCVDVYNSKVLRSTQGALFKISIIEGNIIELIDSLDQYTVYGTSLNGKKLEEIIAPKKVIVILGNEGNGVREEILDKTSDNIFIKISNIESLNVSVAGSIIMYCLK